MKKSLLVSFIIAAVLPAAASASMAIQQANQNIQEPLADATPASQTVKADVDADNVLGHSAAMTETAFALMAHSEQTTRLPSTEHHLDDLGKPSSW
ncbi:hypothetical protein [Vreelandella jeotgali]|uniref:hypothetical protein n=1 Tax=Vreelandella jeotgali TaxID=553386 RepID=UPI0003464183|nr:hypothetical protein [Halomonas jeotgali]